MMTINCMMCLAHMAAGCPHSLVRAFEEKGIVHATSQGALVCTLYYTNTHALGWFYNEARWVVSNGYVQQ